MKLLPTYIHSVAKEALDFTHGNRQIYTDLLLEKDEIELMHKNEPFSLIRNNATGLPSVPFEESKHYKRIKYAAT